MSGDSALKPLSAIFLVACIIEPGAARSATFALVDNSYCKIAMTGSIQAGDFERLRVVTKRLKDTNSGRFSVCLNSLGGDYDEGLKMARLLLEQGVGTVVLPHRQCYSACALMFMFGSFVGTDSARWPNRRLGVEGALGFHAPYLEGADASDPNAKYSANFQQGVRAIGTFLKTLYTTAVSRSDGSKSLIDRSSLNAFFAPELMTAMISKGPNEAFVIRTLDDAGMWGIDVITADPSPTLALQNVFQACTNAVSWRDHEHASPLGPAGLITSANNKPIVQHEGSKTRALLPSFDPLTHEACLVQQFALSDGRVFVDVRLVGENDPQMSLDGEWTPEEVAWTFGYDKSWYLLPPTNVICSESCATVREIPNHQ